MSTISQIQDGDGGKEIRDKINHLVDTVNKVDSAIYSMKLKSVFSKGTWFGEVGEVITLSVVSVVPQGAPTSGVTYHLDRRTIERGTASISGNEITIIKEGNIRWYALAGDVVVFDQTQARPVGYGELQATNGRNPTDLDDPDKSSSSTTIGGTITVTAKNVQGDIITQGIKWVSSDKSIATIDQHGVVTGVSSGSFHVSAIRVTGDGSIGYEFDRQVSSAYLSIS